MLAVRLTIELERRLAALARKTGRTKTYYVREALAEYLADLEDFYLAEERMKTFSEAKAVPLEELLRRDGLAD